MNKYKVGDYVKIKVSISKYYKIYLNPYMTKYNNKISKIVRVRDPDTSYEVYVLEIDRDWVWSYDMIIKVSKVIENE
jgi:hypothetical protein